MLFLYLILAFALSASFVPLAISYARLHNLVDRGGGRKIHSGAIPRLGGVAVFIAFMITIAFLAILEFNSVSALTADLRYWPVFVGAFSMFILGLVDDLKRPGLPARFKAFIQGMAAVLVIGADFRFHAIMVPWGDGSLNLGLLSFPLTLAWIVGVTNAANLIDGMDGLLAVVSTCAALAFGIFFWVKGDVSSTMICIALAGAVLGFFLYNRPKAKIFMGDAGSLSIGFILSVLPLLNQTDVSAEIGFISAVSILFIPIADTLFSILRRLRAGVHPFSPDRGHMHHMLMDMGYSVWQILGIILLFSLLLDLSALSTLVFPSAASFAVKLAAIVLYGLWYMSLILRARKISGSGISLVGVEHNPEAVAPMRHPFVASSHSKKRPVVGKVQAHRSE